MIRRPVYRRTIAEDVELRCLIINCIGIYQSKGIPLERMCEDAKVRSSSLVRYREQEYLDFVKDPRWHDAEGFQTTSYLSDEGILRMADYFGIAVELKVTYNAHLFKRVDEELERRPSAKIDPFLNFKGRQKNVRKDKT